MKEALSSPKRRFLQEPHDVTSQKTPFFIVTAVKTSNLTSLIILEWKYGLSAKYSEQKYIFLLLKFMVQNDLSTVVAISLA
jgi:hypothetical protein